MQYQLEQQLRSVSGTTFAQVEYSNAIKPAAKYKHIDIQKYTTANCQLFNNTKDYQNVYQAAVKRSARKFNNDQQSIDDFESQGSYFEHTDCFSIVKHKTQDKFYLFVIVNNKKDLYTVDGQFSSIHTVAQYLTPSLAKQIVLPEPTYNAKFNIVHDVKVRLISFGSIQSITINGSLIK